MNEKIKQFFCRHNWIDAEGLNKKGHRERLFCVKCTLIKKGIKICK